MNFKFDEAKTTQMAAQLLQRQQGTMNYMKLLKLLYFIDREALSRWNRPVSFDRYYSLPHGQILSNTLNLISEGVPPGDEAKSYWLQHISAPAGYDIQLKSEVASDKLSKAEMALIEEIFDRYGKYDQWELEKLHHQLPEYIDPEGSRVRIEYQDILKALGKTDAQISTVLQELEHLEFTQAILGK